MVITTVLLSLLAIPHTLASYHSPSPPALKFDVFHAAPVPVFFPGKSYTWSPSAFTLIQGEHTAILVDAPPTVNTSHELADWISATAPNKRLTHVFITHGHGDHFFGFRTLQSRFPGLRALATEPTIEHVAEQLIPDVFNKFWAPIFPNGELNPPTIDQVNDKKLFVPLPPHGGFQVDGVELRAVAVGQSDTFNSSVLHVPSLGLVAGGDVVYGSCYQYLAEDVTPALRKQWLAALDDVAALKPTSVVPGHTQADDGYASGHIEATKNYVRAWNREAEKAKDSLELISKIKAEFPNRVGEYILDVSANTTFSG